MNDKTEMTNRTGHRRVHERAAGEPGESLAEAGVFKKHISAKQTHFKNAMIALFYRCETTVSVVKNKPI